MVWGDLGRDLMDGLKNWARESGGARSRKISTWESCIVGTELPRGSLPGLPLPGGRYNTMGGTPG